jgi:hypothetical protein
MEEPLQTELVSSGPPAPPASFGVGVLVSRTFAVWGRCVLWFAPLGLLAHLPIAIGTYLTYRWSPELMQGPSVAPGAGEYLEAFRDYWVKLAFALLPYTLGSVLLTLVVMGAVAHGAARRLAGEPLRLGELLGAGLRAGPAIFGALILFWLASIPALFALVFPAILLAVGWAVTVPAIVVEGAGPIAALRRSWGLTRGYRWHVLAGFVVVYVALMTGVGVLQIPVMAVAMAKGISAGLHSQAAAPDVSFLALPTALMQLLQGAAQTLLLVFPAVAFHGLRAAKEGDDPAHLRRVFE